MQTRSYSAGDCRRRRPIAAAVLLMAAVALVAACSPSSEDADGPGSTQVAAASPTASAASSSSTEPPAGASPPVSPELPPPPSLLPPTAIASVEQPTPGYVVPTVDDVYVPPAQAPQNPGQAPQYPGQVPQSPAPAPQSPAPPPQPNGVDSRGFPLGTTCGPVSCTSPDGLIFVNPDAVPGLGSQGFDLCDHTYCPPPGFQILPDQLPSTGSAGGAPR